MNPTHVSAPRTVSGSPRGGHGFHGTIDGLSLSDMLQLFHQNRRSLTLEIECGGEDVYPHSRRATIHLRDGEVVHAISGEFQGRDALRLALASPAGWIRTRPAEDCGQNVHGPLAALLIDLVPDFEDKTVEVQYAHAAGPASSDGSMGGGNGGYGGNGGGANGNGSAEKPDKKKPTGPVQVAKSRPHDAVAAVPKESEMVDDFSEGGVDYVGRADATATETVSMTSLTHANMQATPSGNFSQVGSALQPGWSGETLHTRDVLPPPPPPETSRLLAVLLGIALALTLVATVLVAVWLLRGPRSLTNDQLAVGPAMAQPSPPPSTSGQPGEPAGPAGAAQQPKAPAAAARRQPETRRVLVSTVPADLELIDASTRHSLGRSPMELSLASPTARVMLRARLGRRYTRPIAITADRPQVTLDLRRWATRRRATRSATPTSATRARTPRKKAESGPAAAHPRETPGSDRAGGDDLTPAIGLIEDDEPALDLIDE